METAYSGTTALGVIAVPTDFLAWKSVSVDISPNRRLDPSPLSLMYTRYPRGGDTGIPAMIARNVGNFEFGPTPDSNYAIVGTYYAKPTVLRTDSDGINWLVTNAPDLLLYGALLEAEPFLKNDSRIVIWKQFYDEALMAYREFQKDTPLSGGPLQSQLA